MEIATRKLMKAMLADLRGHNLGSTYSGGRWDKPIHHTCDLCKAKWKPGKPEAHKPDCLLEQAYKMLRMTRPTMKVRALGKPEAVE